MTSYISTFTVLAIVAFLRHRHVQTLKDRPRDATLVNLNVLLGAGVVLLLGQVVFDVVRAVNGGRP